MGGVGRITGTLIGAMILGLIKSGFTFVGVDAYVQDIIKGIIIVAAVTIDMRRNRKNTILSTGGNGEGCRCRPSCPEINKILPGLRLSVLPALRILYSFATSVVHSSATRGLRFLESYEYTILWQILAALASGKGPYRHAARGAGDLALGRGMNLPAREVYRERQIRQLEEDAQWVAERLERRMNIPAPQREATAAGGDARRSPDLAQSGIISCCW